jgi:hypothetical protein
MQEQVDKELQKVVKLRQEIADRKLELEGPMREVARVAGKHMIFSHWMRNPDKITVEDVRKWIKKIKTDAISDSISEAKAAHMALGALIKAVEGEQDEG